MSRIGKNPVAIPDGVRVELNDQTLTVRGSNATLSLVVSNDVTATVADGSVTIAPATTSRATTGRLTRNIFSSRPMASSGITPWPAASTWR